MNDEHELRTGNPTFDKFMSKLNNPEKMLADRDAVHSMTEKLNEGAPIPAVSARDMKQLWEASRRMNAEMPPMQGGAIGLSIYAAYGVDAACRPVEFFPVSWRQQLLESLLERGVLNDYKHGEELDDKVFEVAATMPCNKDDLGEAMLPFFLAQYPPELAAKAREEMRAAGYDETKPNVVAKFLDLLRANS